MSRGLGKLQRQILDTLAIAKEECQTYRGSYQWKDSNDSEMLHKIFLERRYHVTLAGSHFRLPDDVYDMRCSLKYLAQINDRTYIRSFTDEEFEANFSQAVKRLVKSDYLEAPGYIKVAEICPPFANKEGYILDDSGRMVACHRDNEWMDMIMETGKMVWCQCRNGRYFRAPNEVGVRVFANFRQIRFVRVKRYG